MVEDCDWQRVVIPRTSSLFSCHTATYGVWRTSRRFINPFLANASILLYPWHPRCSFTAGFCFQNKWPGSFRLTLMIFASMLPLAPGKRAASQIHGAASAVRSTSLWNDDAPLLWCKLIKNKPHSLCHSRAWDIAYADTGGAAIYFLTRGHLYF